ncbi:MAG: GreA/GreB family elongation factor [Chitinophagaceae bacterium]
MKKLATRLLITKEDYKLVTSFLRGLLGKTLSDRKNVDDLQAELNKARIIDEEDFPLDVIRLNSRVTMKADNKEDIMELMLVTPDKANIKEKKISVLAPIGTALLGFRQGQQVKWQVPAGERTFTILEVSNNPVQALSSK